MNVADVSPGKGIVGVRLAAIIPLAEAAPVDSDDGIAGLSHLQAVVIVVALGFRANLGRAVAHNVFLAEDSVPVAGEYARQRAWSLRGPEQVHRCGQAFFDVDHDALLDKPVFEPLCLHLRIQGYLLRHFPQRGLYCRQQCLPPGEPFVLGCSMEAELRLVHLGQLSEVRVDRGVSCHGSCPYQSCGPKARALRSDSRPTRSVAWF